LTKVDLSPDLENVLEEVLEDTDKLKAFSDQLGLGGSGGGGGSEAPSDPAPSGGGDDSSGPAEEGDQ
jgi:hypothetical protein